MRLQIPNYTRFKSWKFSVIAKRRGMKTIWLICCVSALCESGSVLASEDRDAEISASTILLSKGAIALDAAPFDTQINTVIKAIEAEHDVKIQRKIIGETPGERESEEAFKWSGTYIGLLELICDVYGYSMDYDLSKNCIIFTEVRRSGTSSESAKRVVWMPEEIARGMGFRFPLDSPQAHDQCLKIGCLVNVMEVKGNKMKISGSLTEIQKFESLILATATRLGR